MSIENQIVYLEVDLIHPHPQNPRRDLGDLTELAESIKSQGIMQNLTVLRQPWSVSGTKPVEYTVIIGHRRLAASKLAGLKEVPCVIIEDGTMDEKTQVGVMLLENMQRNDLTVIEQAQGFQMMLDLGETSKTIAEKTGFSEKTVRRRLFVASLDEKKAKGAYERGATLEEYMKLYQITDENRRNKLLESLGTNNFDHSLRNAIAEELYDRVAPTIIEQIAAFATPTDKQSWEIKGYQNCYDMRCSFEDYENKGELGFKIPTKFEPDEYLYYVSTRGVDIYKKGENFKPEVKMADLPPAEQEERREKRRKYKELKEMGETTYQLRRDFVKAFSQKATLNTGQFEALSELAFAAVCLGERLAFDAYASVEGLDTEKSWNMKFPQKVEAVKKSKAPPAKVLLVSLYSTFKDSAENTYYFGVEASAEKRGYYKENNKLNAIYDCLCALGYQMSDDEQMLRDGTHELLGELSGDERS